LFTADATLFPGGVGKTTSPENSASLINDVKSRLFDVLPDDTWFYPGHGDDSTLGEERWVQACVRDYLAKHGASSPETHRNSEDSRME
jgi:glyoxylase-like metal-dependent hydrolase (beta-lactamase superfamily II)